MKARPRCAPGSRSRRRATRRPSTRTPYVEVITVLEGAGEAWAEGEDAVRLEPGVTLILPPGQRHGFRVTGDVPLKTLGIHASPHRIVDIAGE